MNWTRSGPNNVPDYLMSGIPFVTSSKGDPVSVTPRKISFPFVTRFFVLTNLSSDPMRLGFSENGVNGIVTNNYLILSGNQSTPRLEIRCKEIWIRSDSTTNEYSLLAGLTCIRHDQFPVLTSSFHGTSSFEGVG